MRSCLRCLREAERADECCGFPVRSFLLDLLPGRSSSTVLVTYIITQTNPRHAPRGSHIPRGVYRTLPYGLLSRLL